MQTKSTRGQRANVTLASSSHRTHLSSSAMVRSELGGFSDGQHVHTVHLEPCGGSPAHAAGMNTSTASVTTPGNVQSTVLLTFYMI